MERASNKEADEIEKKSLDEETCADPQIAFLFLSRGDVNHPQIWRDYLAQSEGNSKIYAHCKDTHSLGVASFLLPHLIDEQIPTEWSSTSIVEATLALIHAAHKDSSNTLHIRIGILCSIASFFGASQQLAS